MFARAWDYKELVYLNYVLKVYLMTRYGSSGLLEVNVVQKLGAAEATLRVEDVDEFLLASQCEMEQLASEVNAWFSSDVRLNLKQVGNAAVHPVRIANKLASDVANNTSVKASIRLIAKEVMAAGAVGLKASYSGRIYGVTIAQTVWHIEGRIPLHTLAADVRYSNLSVRTVCGVCNVKVWVCLNDLSTSRVKAQEAVQGKAKAQKQGRQLS
ncbi:MAG: hypothetical protein P3M74_00365 [Candidatus Hodgkinia cicadicola]|nr:MAG: hypothetical protein P3M74_00365 [Candidatus Hodgkinia cicadicola]